MLIVVTLEYHLRFVISKISFIFVGIMLLFRCIFNYLVWACNKIPLNIVIAVQNFLKLNQLNYTPISYESKEDLKEQLTESTVGLTDAMVTTSDFYKVPFRDVLPLIKGRKVFLKEGFVLANSFSGNLLNIHF